MELKKKIIMPILLLFLLQFFIVLDIGIKSVRDDTIVINESVQFNEFTNNRIIPFNVNESGFVEIHTLIEVENGDVDISIINPQDEVVYETDEEVKNEKVKKIEVYKGVWKYRIICRDAENGKYTILGKVV